MKDIKAETLPGILAEIARVAGLDKALECAERLGNSRMEVTARLTESNRLAAIIGVDHARAVLSLYVPGEVIRFPSAIPFRRWRTARAMRAGGKSVRDIAAALSLSERRVQTLIQGVAKGRAAGNITTVPAADAAPGKANRERLP